MGQTPYRALITDVTNAKPCVVTTNEAHEYATHQFVRITDLNGSIPVLRGMDEINNKKFRIVVVDSTSFLLQDPITYEEIDSTNYPPYVTGGRVNLVESEFIYHGDNDA